MRIAVAHKFNSKKAEVTNPSGGLSKIATHPLCPYVKLHIRAHCCQMTIIFDVADYHSFTACAAAESNRISSLPVAVVAPRLSPSSASRARQAKNPMQYVNLDIAARCRRSVSYRIRFPTDSCGPRSGIDCSTALRGLPSIASRPRRPVHPQPQNRVCLGARRFALAMRRRWRCSRW